MAKTYRYVGPHDAVLIEATGQVVERGHQVVIEEPEVAKGMDGQDTWEHIPDKKRSRAAKKAAASKPPATTTEKPAADAPAKDEE